MRRIVKRNALLGALATTMGIAAPAAVASTASATAGPAANGQLIVGPTATGAIIITTAPTSFINTNNQTSAVGNWTAGQVLAP